MEFRDLCGKEGHCEAFMFQEIFFFLGGGGGGPVVSLGKAHTLNDKLTGTRPHSPRRGWRSDSLQSER